MRGKRSIRIDDRRHVFVDVRSANEYEGHEQEIPSKNEPFRQKAHVDPFQ